MGVLVVLFCCVWADVGIVCLIGNLACFVMWFFAGLNVDGYTRECGIWRWIDGYVAVSDFV